MQEIELKAYAKINLALYVGKKRPDGYHDISSIMQMVDLYDVVKIKKNLSGEIICRTDCRELASDESNIAFKAAMLMCEQFKIECGFDIYINKNIPLGGGMAGGSTDAAAVIKGINELCGLNENVMNLCRIGKKIGADVPFCIYGKTALAEGIGEKLSATEPLKNCFIVLVNPNINISTGKIFNMMDEKERVLKNCDEIKDALKNNDFKQICKLMDNDMQEYTQLLCPEIGDVINNLKMLGAENAIMSGSGSTCFGVFEKEPHMKALKEIFGDYFVYIAKPVS